MTLTLPYLLIGALLLVLAEIRHRRKNAERYELNRYKAAQRGYLL